jgi:hypothetical protein
LGYELITLSNARLHLTTDTDHILKRTASRVFRGHVPDLALLDMFFE